MPVLFIVNGAEDSIYGRRVRNLTKYFQSVKQYRIAYRDDKAKIKSIFRFLWEIFKYKPEIVYVEQIAYSACTAVLLARLFARFKYIFCVSDLYAELAKANHNKIVVFLASIMERLWINSADFLLTCNSVHSQWIQGKTKKDNVDYVGHGIDSQIFKPCDQRELKQRLGLENSLVVGLVGSLTWSKRYKFCYGWDIVEALKFLKDLDIKALIVGDGTGLEYLKQSVRYYAIEEKVVFTGRVANEQVADYINCMDICVSTQSNDPVGALRCLATKGPEYMACGKYIIATDVGKTKLYFEKLGGILPYEGVKDETYPGRLALHLRQLYFNRGLLEKGKKGIEIARVELDYRVLSEKLEAIIMRMGPG